MYSTFVHCTAMLSTLFFLIIFAGSVRTGKTKSYEEILISRIDHDLQNLRHRLRYSGTTVKDIKPSQNFGSTYVRWGHNNCPKQSKLVYDGYGAGKKYKKNGGGANYLCMTKKPEYTNLKSQHVYKSLYGVETDTGGFSPDIFDNDLSCAVCYTPKRTSVLTIPGQKSCPSGWTMEYWGYLMAESTYSERQPTQYICTDHQPIGVKGGDKNNNDGIVYLVGGTCGSLKCPPYINGKPLTCAVCSR